MFLFHYIWLLEMIEKFEEEDTSQVMLDEHTTLPRKIMNSFKRLNLTKGIITDLKTRIIPYYKSDIIDGFTNYRVIPSTIYVFFTNLLPAIAFAQDMFDHTKNSYGVNEILASSAMGGIVFGIAGNPLCIVGVTGPISIFYYTVYELIEDRDTDYYSFMCWICLWSMLLHFIIAIFNWVRYMSIVTKYSCNVFGLFINIVYIQKGIQILSKQFDDKGALDGFASVTLALVMAIFGLGCFFFGDQSIYLNPLTRKFFKDYGIPLGVLFWSGFIHFGGYLNDVDFQTLPTTTPFHPTASNSHARQIDWFIRFWHISVGDVFLALPFGILLTALFYFDHNISSLICQSTEFPLKKPSSFHWDFMLLGLTTGVSGLIGIPAPNGLIPQAPLHTESLCIYEFDHETGTSTRISVVEQRLTNTLQGVLILIMMCKPLLHVLGLIPQAVLAGLFWIMAISALDGNAIINKLRFICTDPNSLKQGINKNYSDNWFKIEKKWFLIFLVFELIAFGCEFGITLTKGAVGFPGVLMAFMYLATWFPSIFPPEQLELLDEKAADEMILNGLKVT
ncbi:hypothetical protein CANARDRAFT_215023 [[Candida] arabinofermentans NRRL YB-2248]|uniref:Bicarbonate transporter-like transmembrane domain-containing protein n=1 Tax=[Candida] arabinofermentans NRRL YB-2248 TaxID=983967 RepID=A0A1E4STH8_9ASCO|nr:hypothetical protein CANARDRAFT_215023 [[Candida] arabinofermentans NRRL YB-2248]